MNKKFKLALFAVFAVLGLQMNLAQAEPETIKLDSAYEGYYPGYYRLVDSSCSVLLTVMPTGSSSMLYFAISYLDGCKNVGQSKNFKMESRGQAEEIPSRKKYSGSIRFGELEHGGYLEFKICSQKEGLGYACTENFRFQNILSL